MTVNRHVRLHARKASYSSAEEGLLAEAAAVLGTKTKKDTVTVALQKSARTRVSAGPPLSVTS